GILLRKALPHPDARCLTTKGYSVRLNVMENKSAATSNGGAMSERFQIHKTERLEQDVPYYKAHAERLAEALRRIAYEPQGAADASHAEVLRAVENIAREALAQSEGAKQ